jgi:hypothetical protein
VKPTIARNLLIHADAFSSAPSWRCAEGNGLELIALRRVLNQLLPAAAAVFLGVAIGGAFVVRTVIRGGFSPIPARHDVSMVTVFGNYAVDPELAAQWGFDAVVVTPAKKNLFDTGSDGQMLLSNMAKLRIRPKEIHKIVISHVHLDHLGGLEGFLKV